MTRLDWLIQISLVVSLTAVAAIKFSGEPPENSVLSHGESLAIAGIEVLLVGAWLAGKRLWFLWGVVGIAMGGLALSFLSEPWQACGCFGRARTDQTQHRFAASSLGLLASLSIFRTTVPDRTRDRR